MNGKIEFSHFISNQKQLREETGRMTANTVERVWGDMEQFPRLLDVVERFNLASGTLGGGSANALLIYAQYPNAVRLGSFEDWKKEQAYIRKGEKGIRIYVTRILDDERYTGIYIIGKREVTEVGSHRQRLKDESQWVKIPNHHPPIVSKEEFQEAQAKRRHFKCPKKNKRAYPLRSKVICGLCRQTLARAASKEPYFHCRQAGVIPASPCYKLSIRESALHGLLYEILSKQAQIILGTADIGTKNMGSLSAEHSGYSQQISEIQEHKRVLFEQMILGELSESEYRDKKAALDNELVRLQEVQAGLSTQLSRQQADVETRSVNRRLAQKVVDTGQLSTELVDALIERVYVYPEQKIEIVWKVGGFGSDGKELQKNF